MLKGVCRCIHYAKTTFSGLVGLEARTSTPFWQILRTVALGHFNSGGFMMAVPRVLLPEACCHITLHIILPVSIAVF